MCCQLLRRGRFRPKSFGASKSTSSNWRIEVRSGGMDYVAFGPARIVHTTVICMDCSAISSPSFCDVDLRDAVEEGQSLGAETAQALKTVRI